MRISLGDVSSWWFLEDYRDDVVLGRPRPSSGCESSTRPAAANDINITNAALTTLISDMGVALLE